MADGDVTDKVRLDLKCDQSRNMLPRFTHVVEDKIDHVLDSTGAISLLVRERYILTRGHNLIHIRNQLRLRGLSKQSM